MDDVTSVLVEMLKDYFLKFLANDWPVIPIIVTVFVVTIAIDLKYDRMRDEEEELQLEKDLLTCPEDECGGESSWE